MDAATSRLTGYTPTPIEAFAMIGANIRGPGDRRNMAGGVWCRPTGLLEVAETTLEAVEAPLLDVAVPSILREPQPDTVWRIVVRAKVPAEAFPEAIEHRATRACRLLTVVFGDLWRPWSQAQPEGLHIEDRTHDLLDHARRQKTTWLRERWALEIENDPPPRDVPLSDVAPWLDEAWRVVERHPLLNDALNGYYEGCQMLADHPSFAVVAFVAAIEAIGLRSNRAARPEADAVETFRCGLREFTSDESLVHFIAKHYYDARSRVVHTATLFGTEHEISERVGGLIDPTSSRNTSRMGLRLRLLTRELLLRTLGPETAPSARFGDQIDETAMIAMLRDVNSSSELLSSVHLRRTGRIDHAAPAVTDQRYGQT